MSTSNASGQWSVTVPDSTRTFKFPKTMSVEEVRASLVNVVGAYIESASAVISPDGDSISFQRVTGGTKGL